MTPAVIPNDLQPVERGYRNSLRVQAAIFWLFPLVGAVVLDRFVLAETWAAGLVPLAIAFFAFGGVVLGPDRIYRRLGYALDERLIRIVRGWLFHVDTVVPFVRVQHIDVTRGPFDKMCGTASLVVHTAGTHNSVVTLPGLAPERAASIRDLIRAEIRADAE
ncbi:PH domain-containing protein [Sphingomonas mesophila]|uniref:PH domain-containing protein n=1 Tax=Sphingomonas mesophila TaxID=2303576 RepID=UPI000E597BFA|nr:PH domain-containing protein [Sphingomonas mesophila]